MPNGVKYSTTTPSGSLRRDNVALGVNGNLGPTANTGFYSMPTPASGKYIINKVAASGVPNFFAPQNDAELIRFAKQEGATGADTGSAAAVLSWIATQPNLEAANFEYENIVTDGLVFNTDAGFVGSYPTINTTWYDLSGNSNNGTLTNGPTFSSANSGSIVFDGVDDLINAPAINVGTNFTVNVWAKVTTATRMILLSNAYLYTTNKGFLFNVGNNGTDLFLALGQDQQYRVSSNGYVSANTWFCASTTFDGTTIKLYYNGVETTYQATFGSISTLVYDANPIYLGRGTYDTFQGNIATAQMYNRALSAAEVLQNYNAQKGRFGL
jgi:hypothetical protein